MSKGTGFEYLEGTPIADPGNDPTPAATPRTRLWPDSGAAGGLRYRPSASAAGRPIQAPTFPAIVPVVANTTALDGQCVFYNPSGGTFTIKAPANPSLGSMFWTKNVTSSTAPITIDGNGKNLEVFTTPGVFLASFITSIAGQLLAWIYDGTNWVIFNEALNILIPLPTSLVVAPGATSLPMNGSFGLPYSTIPAALAVIPAVTQPRQEDTWNLLLYSRNLSSDFVGNITLPNRRNISLVGTSAFEFIHGTVTWTNDYTTINGDSFLLIEDVAISANLVIADVAGPGVGATFVEISMARFNSLSGDGNIQGMIDATAASRLGSLSLIGGVVVGATNCPFGTIYATDAHLGGLVTANLLYAVSSTFGNIVASHAEFRGCQWTVGSNPTINGPASVVMDGDSYASFIRAGGTFQAGTQLTRLWQGLRKETVVLQAANITLAAGSGWSNVVAQQSVTFYTPTRLEVQGVIGGANIANAQVASGRILLNGTPMTGSDGYFSAGALPGTGAVVWENYNRTALSAVLAPGTYTLDLQANPDENLGTGNLLCFCAADGHAVCQIIIRELDPG